MCIHIVRKSLGRRNRSRTYNATVARSQSGGPVAAPLRTYTCRTVTEVFHPFKRLWFLSSLFLASTV